MGEGKTRDQERVEKVMKEEADGRMKEGYGGDGMDGDGYFVPGCTSSTVFI